MAKEISWIKITTNIFDDEKIQLIEELPEADTIIVIWFKLLVLAGKRNDCGLIYITRDIPYDPEKLSRVLRRPLNIVKLAIDTFIKFGMIFIDNQLIGITNWEKHQNIEGMDKLRLKWKEASQRYRANQKIQIEHHKTSYDGHNTDKSRVDKIRIEKNRKNLLEEEFYQLTEQFYKDLIHLVNPSRYKTNKPNLERWSDSIRLLHTLNGVPYINMRQVWLWAMNDSFWKAQILSTANFREHYDRLKIKMMNEGNKNKDDKIPDNWIKKTN